MSYESLRREWKEWCVKHDTMLVLALGKSYSSTDYKNWLEKFDPKSRRLECFNEMKHRLIEELTSACNAKFIDRTFTFEVPTEITKISFGGLPLFFKSEAVLYVSSQFKKADELRWPPLAKESLRVTSIADLESHKLALFNAVLCYNCTQEEIDRVVVKRNAMPFFVLIIINQRD